MLRKPTLIVIFLLFIQLGVYGQSEKSDPFKADTLHANRLIKKAKSILYHYPDSAGMYMDTLLTLSAGTNYQFGYYTAYNLKGIAFWLTNHYDLAISSYHKALLAADNLEDKREKAKI